MKWEYKVVKINEDIGSNNPEMLQNEFNKYGSENWEIIQVMSEKNTGYGWLPSSETKNIILKRCLG